MKINENLAISDNGFLFNATTGESFTVNPIGAEIIEMLKSGETGERIISRILDLYDTDKKTVEKDLHDFSDILKQYQLLSEDE